MFTPVPPQPGLGIVRSLLVVLMVVVLLLEALLFSTLWLVRSMDTPPEALTQLFQTAENPAADTNQPLPFS